jgi:methionine-rich copper-binding protein CopC
MSSRRAFLHLAVAAGALVVLGSSARAAMHLRLVKSEPAKNAIVAAPTQLRLWFSLKPTVSLTSVKLTTASDVAIKVGKPVHTGDVKLPVVFAVEEPLAPGKYTVSWKTASNDMHPMTGDFTFTVK